MPLGPRGGCRVKFKIKFKKAKKWREGRFQAQILLSRVVAVDKDGPISVVGAESHRRPQNGRL